MENINSNPKPMPSEYDKRPWMTVAGLVISILSWIAVFIPIFNSETEYSVLGCKLHGHELQGYLLMLTALIGGLLSLWGIKRAPGMGLIGIVAAAFLLLTLICGMIGAS